MRPKGSSPPQDSQVVPSRVSSRCPRGKLAEARPVTDHRGAATPPVGHVLPTRSGTSHALEPLLNARIGKGGVAIMRGIARAWPPGARIKKLGTEWRNKRGAEGVGAAMAVDSWPRPGIKRRVTAGWKKRCRWSFDSAVTRAFLPYFLFLWFLLLGREESFKRGVYRVGIYKIDWG